jgi:hypothetical protein
MVDNINEISLKKISLKVKDINKHPRNFIRSRLVVPDSLNGNSRSVDIDYLIEDDFIYLKSVEPLFKCEFEELFNFTNREFKIDKIISISLNSVIIN